MRQTPKIFNFYLKYDFDSFSIYVYLCEMNKKKSYKLTWLNIKYMNEHVGDAGSGEPLVFFFLHVENNF